MISSKIRFLVLLKSIHLPYCGAFPGTGADTIVAIFIWALREESGENQGQAPGSILGHWDCHSTLPCFVAVWSSLLGHDTSLFPSIPLRGS